MAHYRITVLEIGYGENIPASFYLGDFADPELTFPVHPFSMTLVQGEGRNILIDTGINTEDPVKQGIIAAAGIGHTRSPREVLETVGLKPEDIDTVILTHAHFDHAGALECYPNATFYIQRRELAGWNEFLMDGKLQSIGIFSMDPGDVKRLNALKEEGRLKLLEGDVVDLFPGITIKAAGFGHSFGLQMVLIETDDGLFVHVGDVANRPENLTGTDAFPFYLPNTKFGVGSPYYTVADYDRLMQWTVGKTDRVIMTHDGSRRERYPESVGPLELGIYRIC